MKSKSYGKTLCLGCHSDTFLLYYNAKRFMLSLKIKFYKCVISTRASINGCTIEYTKPIQP